MMPTPSPAPTRTPSERQAEDTAYTINHALVCTATDFVDPYIGNLTQKWMGKRVSIGCGHNHGAGESCDAPHGPVRNGAYGLNAKPKTRPVFTAAEILAPAEAPAAEKELGSLLWKAEFAGDFAAVPLTVLAKRVAPGVMHDVQRLSATALSPFFHRSARKARLEWADSHGTLSNAPEALAVEKKIYDHEVEHLPEALVWTASSIGLNLAAQRYLGNEAPMAHMAAGKISGALVSTALVLGARAATPQTAQRWDEFSTQHVFLPATRAVGRVFGVDPNAVDRMAARQSWQDRVEAPAAAIAASR